MQVESVNYDYLPGEPESRRTWYITLRFPPKGIIIGDIIYLDKDIATKVNILEVNGVPLGNLYRVYDIHFRNLVVDPIHIQKIQRNTEKDCKNQYIIPSVLPPRYFPGNSSKIPRMGTAVYMHRPYIQYTQPYTIR